MIEISSFGKDRGVVFDGGSHLLESEMVDILSVKFPTRVTPDQATDLMGELLDAYEEKHFVPHNVKRRLPASGVVTITGNAATGTKIA